MTAYVKDELYIDMSISLMENFGKVFGTDQKDAFDEDASRKELLKLVFMLKRSHMINQWKETITCQFLLQNVNKSYKVLIYSSFAFTKIHGVYSGTIGRFMELFCDLKSVCNIAFSNIVCLLHHRLNSLLNREQEYPLVLCLVQMASQKYFLLKILKQSIFSKRDDKTMRKPHADALPRVIVKFSKQIS